MKIIDSLTLIDSGAPAYGFIDTKFAHNHGFELIKLPRPRILRVFDGSDAASGTITYLAKTVLDIDGHTETMLLFVTSLAYFDLVLGLPRLEHHSPRIDWKQGILEFNSPTCYRHSKQFSTRTYSVSQETIKEQQERSFCNDSAKTIVKIENCDIHTFEESFKRIDHFIMAIAIDDTKEALRDKPIVNPADKLPKIYQEFLHAFSKEEADKLPRRRPSDHKIVLKPASEATWGLLYGMS